MSKEPEDGSPKPAGRKPKPHGKPFVKTGPNKILRTVNSKLPTKDMEVHHHPHVEKKPSKTIYLRG